jgi:long-chain acyl-CoA synthetase
MFDRVEWFCGVTLLNLFPLPRQAGFRDSFRFAGASVDRGYSILVFPEGRHTTTGRMNPFRTGIGLLAQNLGIPVVPMRIDGLFELKKAGRRVARPYQIKISMGQPRRFGLEDDPERVAAELQRLVEEL